MSPSTQKNQHTAGIVLAGGGSRRMGEDKAKLRCGGVSLLLNARALLSDANLSNVFACGRRDDCEIREEKADTGPLGGILASIAFCRPLGVSVLVFVPVDMPLLCPADLQVLIDEARNSGRPACFESGPLPLCIPLTEHIITTTQAHCDGEDLSLKAWLRKLQVSVCHSDFPEHFLNINYPAQWQAYTAVNPLN